MNETVGSTQILVVEDEGIVALDIKNRLISLGYHVPAIASSAEGAIKKAEEIRPALVLMNIGLKGDMDGIEAAKQIQDRFNIPAVYMTGYTDEKTLERAKATEPLGFIFKPVDDDELKSVIEKAVSRALKM